jgi:aryl-alcohol dehydrogenase-like predicted oxidoreductase
MRREGALRATIFLQMKYRPLGSTGLSVSEISFGSGDNAGLMVLGSEEQQTAAVARALELGVNYFDTSPDYGKGVAEVNLGKVLRRLDARKKAIVATKVEVMPEDINAIEAKIARSLEESLERLGMDSVDILMIHNAPRLQHDLSASGWIPLVPADYLGPCIRALEVARKAGKVAHFGFACERAEPAATIPVLESGYFGVINAWYSLVNPTSGYEMPPETVYSADYEDYGGIITRAAAAGVGVAVIRPLAGGALAPSVVSGGVTNRHPLAGGGYSRNPESFRPEADRGRAFAFLHHPDRSLPQAAYAFILANPAVSTVIGGFSDLAQFEELVAMSGCAPLTDAELAQIRDVYRHNFATGD